MKTYRVTLTGQSPLLMHHDNIEWSDSMKRWRQDPENKKKSVAGDDRSPAHTWIGAMYHGGGRVVLPADNIMRCLMEGGAQVVVPGGKNGKTFKAQTQSGMMVVEEFWPLMVNGKTIDVAPLLKLTKVEDFSEHCEAALAAGFSLFVKRAKVGSSKHVRVRPRFDRWSASGEIQVWDDQLTMPALKDILKMAGSLKGLGDWRPSGKTPGPFGRFVAEIKES